MESKMDEDLLAELKEGFRRATKYNGVKTNIESIDPPPDNIRYVTVHIDNEGFYTSFKEKLDYYKPKYMQLVGAGTYEVFNMEAKRMQERVWVRLGYVL